MRRYLLLVSVCLVALGAPRAQANPSPPLEPPERAPITGSDSVFTFMLVNGSSGIPANGALLLQGPYDQVPTVAVRNLSTSMLLSGALEPIEATPFWIWRPDVPLPVDATCEVEIMSETSMFEPNRASFDVVAAIQLEQPTLVTTPGASLISVASEKACCRAQFTAGAGLESASQCFAIGYESSVHVEPGVLTMSGQVQANQYLFRFSTGPGERPVYSTGSFNGLVLPVYREQADEYCFEVEAIELPTLRELAYDDLDTCAEHGALADLGPMEVEPNAVELSHVVCQAPPAGYEELWCEVNQDCEDDATSGCQLYPHVCEGEALPTWRSEADASIRGDGDSDDDGDSEPDEDDARSGGSSSGCAATGARGEAGIAAHLACLIALALTARRQRLGPGKRRA